MYKMKRIIALVMTALLIGSTACGPVLAAEVTGEEPVSVQEGTPDKEEVQEAVEENGTQEGSSLEITTEPQDEPDDIIEDVQDPRGQDVESENAAEGTVDSETSEVSEEVLPETEESQEISGKNATENTEAASTTEPEDEYLPLVIVDGVTDETENDASGALAAWDAEKLASLPVLDTDVSSASGGCVMMGLPGEYIADQQAVLDRINEIRREACEEGVINPETNRPLTMSDYVPLKWSRELEEIARIRAAEASITGYHKRTNGDSWQSVDSEYTYVGECVAWNYSANVFVGISQWYGEKKYWLEGNEEKSGHYTTLIRPAMRYVGEGTFYSPYTEYPNTTLVEFYSTFAGSGLDESFVDMTGECIQKLEVTEGSLQGNPYITGTLSGVKGDEQQLFLMTKATCSGPIFTANTKGLLFEDGVSWSSSNSGIASLSADGTVKAVKCGSATITAQAENGSSTSAAFVVDHVLKKLPAVEATCTASGLTEGEKCANCGKVTIAQKTVPAKGHAYGSWKVTKKATCTAAGSREKVCANCGDKVTEAIDATGHKWNTTYTVDKAATCAEEGSESKHCSVCNAIDKSTVRAISKKAHTYGSWKVTKKATCTAAGSREKTCTSCGKKVTETIKATGHKWNSYYTCDKIETCITEGSESIHCSVCNAIDKSTKRTIPKTEHTYGKWKVTKDSTMTEAGSRERVCKVCGYKETEVLPPLRGTWKKDSKGWWYQWDDGSYPISRFLKIAETTYYFNADGYMVTGWQSVNGKWYYFDGSGAMVTGWKQIGGKWYYLASWKKGAMVTGFQLLDEKLYYFKESGEMATGWQSIFDTWYYFDTSGVMVTGWKQIDGKWYYLAKWHKGAMVTGWQTLDGKKYYFKGSGEMVTGWQVVEGKWYYFEADGEMAAEKWVGDYYLTKSGSMAKSTWIGSYYVGADGKWIPGYKAAN